MHRTIARALPAAALAALALVPAAQAGTPGTWTALTSPLNGASPDTVSLARTPDGVLHVASERRSPANAARDDLQHTAIRPDGSIATSNLILSAFATVAEPALVVEPAGLRVVFGGAPDTTPQVDPALRTATAPLDGSVWTLADAKVASGTNAHLGAGDAVLAPDGSLISIFGELGLRTQRGLTELADANAYPILQASCCAYGPALATSAASGQVWAGWFSNAARPDNPSIDDQGYMFQALDPATGAGTGPVRKAPESSIPSGNGERALPLNSAQEVALAALGGGQAGVLYAYAQGFPTIDRVRVYDLVAGKLRTIPGSKGGEVVALAADPAGRAWLAFSTDDERIVVRRSNVGATVWGAAVRVKAPKGAGSIWSLTGDAQAGLLDLVATATTTGVGAFHTQVRPGLSLKVAPATVSSATGGTFTFTVTDAGVAVAGAKVKVGQKTLTTNAKGVAKLVVQPDATRGTRKVAASKPGYVGAASAVGIKR